MGLLFLKMEDSKAWEQKVQNASDTELLELQRVDYLGLRKSKDEFWQAFVNNIEAELERRGLKC